MIMVHRLVDLCFEGYNWDGNLNDICDIWAKHLSAGGEIVYGPTSLGEHFRHVVVLFV
jgi:hypothetical protein